MSIVKDQGFSLVFNSTEKVDNWLGRLGAVVSHLFIYKWFGITSYLFVLNSFLIGVRLVFGISILPVKKILKHSFFVLIWLSITLGYLFNTIASDDVYHLMGGTFGIVSDIWLQGVLGNIGTGIFLVFAFVSYLIVAFNISFDWGKKSVGGDGDENLEETETATSTMTGAGIEIGSDPEAKTDEDAGAEEVSEVVEEGGRNGTGDQY